MKVTWCHDIYCIRTRHEYGVVCAKGVFGPIDVPWHHVIGYEFNCFIYFFHFLKLCLINLVRKF